MKFGTYNTFKTKSSNGFEKLVEKPLLYEMLKGFI